MPRDSQAARKAKYFYGGKKRGPILSARTPMPALNMQIDSPGDHGDRKKRKKPRQSEKTRSALKFYHM